MIIVWTPAWWHPHPLCGPATASLTNEHKLGYPPVTLCASEAGRESEWMAGHGQGCLGPPPVLHGSHLAKQKTEK